MTNGEKAGHAISAARKGGATDFFITPSFLLTSDHWSTLNQIWK